MKADRLLALYDRVAAAPDAIVRLRRFVLDLAVRGRLVEQDPADEPAPELLKRIEAERVRLAGEGGFREPRSAVKIGRQELPFGSPDHWAWVRLIEIARISYGFAFKSSQFNTKKLGMPLIRIRDISKTDAEAYFEGDYDSTYIVRAGDYLVGMDGNFNLHCWKGRDGLLNQRVMRINGWRCKVNPEFVRVPLQMVLNYLHGGTSLTTVKHLSAKQVNGIEIPLPPLAEQHRIVAKVDELMALCDRLEGTRAAREETRGRLTKASYARLSDTDTDAPTFRAHARFAVDGLPELTARANQVKRLRQTILTLAVRGNLVEQDPTDEPASELLKRILVERETLVRAKRIKAVRVAPISLGETPFRVPSNWQWTRLGNVGDWGAGSTPLRSNTDFFGGEVTWLKSGELNDSRHLLGSEETVTQLALDSCSFRRNRPGDVLIAMYGATIGKLAIRAESAVTNQAVCGCSPFDGVLSEFLFFFLLSQRRTFRRSSESGAQPNISKVKIVAAPFPLPPFAEQQRIVAKVDELMALCDRLEAGLGEAGGTRSRLVDSILQEALGDREASVGARAVGGASIRA